jgi:hypothetical protein
MAEWDKQRLREIKGKRIAKCKAKYLDEIQELADYICDAENHQRIPIEIKDTRAAWARYKAHKITMSVDWCMDTMEARWATIIHEVCHFLEYRDWEKKNGWNPRARHSTTAHGEAFKRYETKWLHEFGLQPVYGRAYGQVLWTC